MCRRCRADECAGYVRQSAGCSWPDARHEGLHDPDLQASPSGEDNRRFDQGCQSSPVCSQQAHTSTVHPDHQPGW